MLNFTKPIQTRDGKPVRILSADEPTSYPIVGYIGENNTPDCWTREGYFRADHWGSQYDLVNAPEPITEIYQNFHGNRPVKITFANADRMEIIDAKLCA